MAYFQPYVDESGLHIPTYSDILAYELEQFRTVYGASVNLDDDSADKQWISVFSLLASDVMNAIQLAYNARSPLTAVGADLDSIVKINGIARKAASYSTAVLTITGVAGTVIPLGVIQDQSGYLWDLPANVNIPVGGSVNVQATCETAGAVIAAPGTITTISTPTSGWNTVTNANAAVVGAPVETDSQLRARQSLSVALSSKTMVIGTLSAIATLPGVTRYAKGIPSPSGTSTSVENPTGGADYFGNPAHSISMVVEGGNDTAIATAIYQNKSIGCFTNGSTTIAVVDPNTNNTTNISFFRPTYDRTYVTLVIKGLVGYTSATTSAIQYAVFNYLNGLQIGEELTISGLYGAALAVMPSLLTPQFSIQAVYAGLSAGSIGTFRVNAAGTGYTVGDIVTVAGGTGGQLKVSAIGASGSVTGLVFAAPGSGYSTGTGLATTTGGAGTGLTVDLLTVGANGTTDIVPAFNAVVQGLLADVNVQVV